jgi:hypothetical protein
VGPSAPPCPPPVIRISRKCVSKTVSPEPPPGFFLGDRTPKNLTLRPCMTISSYIIVLFNFMTLLYKENQNMCHLFDIEKDVYLATSFRRKSQTDALNAPSAACCRVCRDHRPRKDHFKNDLRSDQDHLLKNDLRSDQDHIFSKK